MFEIPRKIGDKSNILVRLFTVTKSAGLKPPKSNLFKNGMKKNAIILVTTINKKKKVKILPMNFLPS